MSQRKGKVAYLFPGQGSQWVGMGSKLYQRSPRARKVFDEADETLGFSLSKLCFEGPADKLAQTVYAQPAIMTTSIASLEASTESGESLAQPPAFLAGHSLGQYTALVAARVIDFKEAIRLVFERGQLMQEAGQKRLGTMIAIIGLDLDSLEKISQETDTRISNINCPGQVVLSGLEKNVAKAVKLAKEKGARKAILLEVSGAFHSHLMRPALREMTVLISRVTLQDPIYPIIANTTARPLNKASEIKQELIAHMCNCVRWQHSIEYMIGSGVSTFIEIGPGQVLSALIKRIDRSAHTRNIGDTLDQLEATF
jgi:[acyl-carrier-protein] S-malonyltransferase